MMIKSNNIVNEIFSDKVILSYYNSIILKVK